MKDDLGFFVLISTLLPDRIEDYESIDESVPDYYVTPGTKARHFPPVEYSGWPKLE